MARIRTVKPEFFRHEKLQDIELSHPELRPMLVFSGLWGHCDKNGVFEWRPKHLALDILPFVWQGSIGEALEKCLGILRESGLLIYVEKEGKAYGFIPTFKEHQRINGKEAQEESKYPQPSELIEVKQRGSNGEATGKQPRSQEGKGREEEQEGKRKGEKTKTLEAGGNDAQIPPSENEIKIRAAFKAKASFLQGKFPGIDLFVEEEKCVSYYQKNTLRADTTVAVITWVQNARKPAGVPVAVTPEIVDPKWERKFKPYFPRSVGLLLNSVELADEIDRIRETSRMNNEKLLQVAVTQGWGDISCYLEGCDAKAV